MIKTISKIGNSHGLIFDSTLLQLAKLKPGDQVNVEVHSGGTITLTPMNDVEITEEAAAGAAREIIGKNSELFRHLSRANFDIRENLPLLRFTGRSLPRMAVVTGSAPGTCWSLPSPLRRRRWALRP